MKHHCYKKLKFHVRIKLYFIRLPMCCTYNNLESTLGYSLTDTQGSQMDYAEGCIGTGE